MWVISSAVWNVDEEWAVCWSNDASRAVGVGADVDEVGSGRELRSAVKLWVALQAEFGEILEGVEANWYGAAQLVAI